MSRESKGPSPRASVRCSPASEGGIDNQDGQVPQTSQMGEREAREGDGCWQVRPGSNPVIELADYLAEHDADVVLSVLKKLIPVVKEKVKQLEDDLDITSDYSFHLERQDEKDM